MELLVSRKFYPAASAYLSSLVPLDCEETEKNSATLSAAAAGGFKQFPLSALGSNLFNRKFPQSFHHRKFPGRKSMMKRIPAPTDTCNLEVAEWAEEVGGNRRRRQEFEGWTA